jgi:hypothetical protein
LWLYTMTERSIVKSLRVRVIVLMSLVSENRGKAVVDNAYTRVRDPKCCSVSKMNNWPKAPVNAN